MKWLLDKCSLTNLESIFCLHWSHSLCLKNSHQIEIHIVNCPPGTSAAYVPDWQVRVAVKLSFRGFYSWCTWLTGGCKPVIYETSAADVPDWQVAVNLSLWDFYSWCTWLTGGCKPVIMGLLQLMYRLRGGCKPVIHADFCTWWPAVFVSAGLDNLQKINIIFLNLTNNEAFCNGTGTNFSAVFSLS